METARAEEVARTMNTHPLGEWKIDPVTNCAVLVRAVADAPERWLKWAAPYLDPALMDTWAPEPISQWSNIAGILRCSEKKARLLGAAKCFAVDTSEYRVRTTLAEVWTCLSVRIPRQVAP